MFYLPNLKFEASDHSKFMSSETLFYHYEKHHGGYVAKTNELLSKDFSHLVGKTLEEICQTADKPR